MTDIASDQMTPLDWMRLGATAGLLLAGAKCGTFWEGSMEDAMTSGGLTDLDKKLLQAEANAAEELRKEIDGVCEDSALGYASYIIADEGKRALFASQGVTSKWLYRQEVGKPWRGEA